MPLDRPYDVVYAPGVVVQLDAALRWWAEHRDSSALRPAASRARALAAGSA